MLRWRLFAGVAALGALALFVAPTSAQTSLDLLGDKDCFGTGYACVEGVMEFGWSEVTSSGDPYPTDAATNTASTVTWSHSFASTGTGGYLTFRTAGIADIRGPYDVFVDGMLVGQMPYDGFGHILIETFSFALSAAMMADGYVEVSFTPESADTWAIDFSEITASVPEPGTMALMASAMAALFLVGYRREGFGLNL